jgi:predicted amidohydrolase YtcJ
MHEDYAGTPGNRGYLQADAGDLTAATIAAHRSGWQVAAHAIGDRAIDLVLDAYATARRQHPRADTRHRIEHFALSSPRQVSRVAQLCVVPRAAGPVRRRARRRDARRARRAPQPVAVPAGGRCCRSA